MMLHLFTSAIIALSPPEPAVTDRAAPAPADDATQAVEQAAPARTAAVREEPKIVCVNRPVTGSVMTRRVCREERQVRADAAENQRILGDMTRGVAHQEMPLTASPF